MEDNLIFGLGLSQSLLSSAVLIRLVQAMGSYQAAWEASEEMLQASLKPDQVNRLIETRNTIDLESLYGTYQEKQLQLLPFTHSDYPDLLKQSHDPPFLLYLQGNLGVLENRGLAVVGTRQYSDYGRRVVQTLVEQIAPFQPCIISGLAAGIDTLAHQAALKHRLPTVAVFGTGLDKIYPRGNEPLAQKIVAEGGCLMSELPLGMRGDKHTFPKRNRIIAGLCQGTLVVEGDIKSGSLITARCALEDNRQLMAVPGSIFSPTAKGPNHLIQQGAFMVQDGNDIAQAMGWQSTTQLGMSLQLAITPNNSILETLNAIERQVYGTLGDEPMSFDEIQAHRNECSVVELQTTLTMLELQGLITALPGAKFSRN